MSKDYEPRIARPGPAHRAARIPQTGRLALDLRHLVTKQSAAEVRCRHISGHCCCPRPYLGRALAVAIALQLVMVLFVVVSGVTALGVICCVAMTISIWAFVGAEIVTFFRVGLLEQDDVPPGPVARVREDFEKLAE